MMELIRNWGADWEPRVREMMEALDVQTSLAAFVTRMSMGRLIPLKRGRCHTWRPKAEIVDDIVLFCRSPILEELLKDKEEVFALIRSWGDSWEESLRQHLQSLVRLPALRTFICTLWGAWPKVPLRTHAARPRPEEDIICDIVERIRFDMAGPSADLPDTLQEMLIVLRDYGVNWENRLRHLLEPLTVTRGLSDFIQRLGPEASIPLCFPGGVRARSKTAVISDVCQYLQTLLATLAFGASPDMTVDLAEISRLATLPKLGVGDAILCRRFFRKYGRELFSGDSELQWAQTFSNSRRAVKLQIHDFHAALLGRWWEDGFCERHDPDRIAREREKDIHQVARELEQSLRHWQQQTGERRMPITNLRCHIETDLAKQCRHYMFKHAQMERNRLQKAYSLDSVSGALGAWPTSSYDASPWRSDAERELMFAVPGYAETEKKPMGNYTPACDVFNGLDKPMALAALASLCDHRVSSMTARCRNAARELGSVREQEPHATTDKVQEQIAQQFLYQFSDEPVASSPWPCRLCGASFECRLECDEHIRTTHVSVPEYRKKLFSLLEVVGPQSTSANGTCCAGKLV